MDRSVFPCAASECVVVQRQISCRSRKSFSAFHQSTPVSWYRRYHRQPFGLRCIDKFSVSLDDLPGRTTMLTYEQYSRSRKRCILLRFRERCDGQQGPCWSLRRVRPDSRSRGQTCRHFVRHSPSCGWSGQWITYPSTKRVLTESCRAHQSSPPSQVKLSQKVSFVGGSR